MDRDPNEDAKETARKRKLVPPGGPARWLRIVYSGDAAAIGRAFELGDAPRIIGRGSGIPISISDPRMSRRHALIAPGDEPGTHWVEDLGGTNGTFLDGARIEKQMKLEPNRVLSIGDTLFVVDDEVAADELPASPKVSGDEVHELIGVSCASLRMRRSIVTAARGAGSVLLLGATGTGKEIAARAIHRASDRAAKPYAAVNCAAIPADLAEAKLFGTSRGDYTGAVDRRGLFDETDGGSLFLDELGDLPAVLQPKLLRVLESGAIQTLTGAEERKVDVRVIAATHVDLQRTDFRRDLLGRFAWVLRFPSLAERRADILALWEHFLRAHRPDAGPHSYTPELAEALLLHTWPMNVRELQHLAERVALTAADEEPLDLFVLPASWQKPLLDRAAEDDDGGDGEVVLSPNQPSKAELEAALIATDGNIQLAAQNNNWARTQLYRWLRYARINPKKFRKARD